MPNQPLSLFLSLVLLLGPIGLSACKSNGDAARKAAQKRKEQVELEMRRADGPMRHQRSSVRTHKGKQPRCARKKWELSLDSEQSIEVELPMFEVTGAIQSLELSSSTNSKKMKVTLTGHDTDSYQYPVWQISNETERNIKISGYPGCEWRVDDPEFPMLKNFIVTHLGLLETGRLSQKEAEKSFDACLKKSKREDLSSSDLIQSSKDGQLARLRFNVTLLKENNSPGAHYSTLTQKLTVNDGEFQYRYDLPLSLNSENGVNRLEVPNYTEGCGQPPRSIGRYKAR